MLLPVYSLLPLHLTRGSGSTVWDVHGTPYLDLYGGHAVISIGHSHPDYVKAITDQVGRLGFYSNSVHLDIQDELATALGRVAGYPDYKLFLCNSGAEANENALKLASFVTGRSRVISFRGAFHGRTSLAVAATDNPRIVAPVNSTNAVTFVPLNDADAVRAELERGDVAAVIIEGIQGVAGIHLPTDAFLQQLAALCTEYGALLVLDEVQSGVGRTGQFFAHQHAGIRPPLITMAKGLGNGFPIGGVLVHPDIDVWIGELGTTFGGNPLACAAALSVLRVIDHCELIERAGRVGTRIMQRYAEVEGVKAVRGRGLMIGIDLEEPCEPTRTALWKEHRILTGNASSKETIRILPALTIAEDALDRSAEALQLALAQETA
jgi:acetylornithine aminotransferase